MNYSSSKKLLSCLCNNGSKLGNSLEFFKVNIDNQESIVKKMIRAEKKKALKRAKNFGDSKPEDIENEDDNAPTERKVDKDEIKDKIKKGEYDLSHHFSKKGILQLET